MSESAGCPYQRLGVTFSADNAEIQKAFDGYKQAYELLIDPNRRGAFDRERANEKENENKKLKRKIEQLEKELESEKKKNRNGEENQGRIVNDELEKMRKELGNAAGHFFGNDKRPYYDLEKYANVLRLLALGEKVINLKFSKSTVVEIDEAGWTIQFKAAEEYCDESHFQLWFGNGKDGGAKFKAIAHQISRLTGEESNKQELESKKDGTRQVVKYEKKSKVNFVRFNITFL